MADEIKLDEHHCNTCDQCMRSCTHTQQFLEKAQRAGLDMSAAIEENERQRKVAQGIKREFFPHRP